MRSSFKNCNCAFLGLIALVLVIAMGNGRAADPLPKVQVSNVRRVFHNGEHNAFTDLVKFQGRYYLTFRSCPDGHMVHPTASIIVLTSDNLKEWRQVHRFQVPKRDTRDPHFLVFKNRLFVYTGTWYSGDKTLPRDQYDLNLHLGYAVWSDDGSTWNGPTMLEGTFGHYIWRASAYGEKAFLCGRRKIDFEVLARGERREVQSVMLESDDGLIWRKRSLFQEVDGDETAPYFLPDGTVWAIGRRGNLAAQLLKSQPPYASWERKELDRYIGGPLLTRWNNHWVVGGRKSIKGETPKTSLYWLADNGLQEIAELPSGGDNSYPGFLDLGPTQAVVSWYSTHEIGDNGKAITAIYLADLTLTKP
jgi:hypothetical protein